MKPALLDLLRCPQCQSRFGVDVARTVEGEIETGSLYCASGHRYPITKFIPRFVDADAYADSFSRQRLYVRKHFEHYRKDRSGDVQFFPTTGFDPEAMRSGVSLEAGCGYGRFVDVVQRAGGTIVGVDLSTHSIELADDFAGRRPNVHLVQADLFSMPFAPGTFDRVYSIGVLHHTPNTEAAFRAIAPYAKAGGQVSIWVYHPSQKRATDVYRVVTARLNHRVLYGLCIVNQALFSWIRALPGIGWRFNRVIPGNSPGKGSTFWMRVLGDFDGFSPSYAYTHEPEEVAGWFTTAGFRRTSILQRRSAVTGWR